MQSIPILRFLLFSYQTGSLKNTEWRHEPGSLLCSIQVYIRMSYVMLFHGTLHNDFTYRRQKNIRLCTCYVVSIQIGRAADLTLIWS